MNVLFLTQIVPYPPDSGPKVKTYHVLRYLAAQGHVVTLATFAREGETKYLAHLASICAAIHAVPMRRSRVADARYYIRSLRLGLPFLVARDDLPAMRRLISRLTSEQTFDIVHADQLTMGQFALQTHGPRRIFDAHNAVWKIVDRARQTARWFLRPPLVREARLVKAYEGALCRQMDAVLAVSDIDRDGLIEAGASPDNIHIIPIAVDCDERTVVACRDQSAESGEILIASTLFYPPNADGVRWFIREVYPLIRQQAPNARLTIVGPRPPQDIVQFGASHPHEVTVTGYVPDLRPYIERSTLMVVPVRAASGMRVRILEALAQGIPVVTTSMGAEGINVTSGQHLLVADEPDECAQAVVRLLGDHPMACRLAIQGRQLIEQEYDWRVVLPKLEAAYGT